MKRRLRTIEQVFLEDGDHPVYAVAAMPEWEHYDLKKCPAPIREWIQQHCPDVVVEQLAGFGIEYAVRTGGDNAGMRISEFFPKPIFRLGLNAKQARRFQKAWNDSQDNFYFLTWTCPESLRSLGIMHLRYPEDIGGELLTDTSPIT